MRQPVIEYSGRYPLRKIIHKLPQYWLYHSVLFGQTGKIDKLLSSVSEKYGQLIGKNIFIGTKVFLGLKFFVKTNNKVFL